MQVALHHQRSLTRFFADNNLSVIGELHPHATTGQLHVVAAHTWKNSGVGDGCFLLEKCTSCLFYPSTQHIQCFNHPFKANFTRKQLTRSSRLRSCATPPQICSTVRPSKCPTSGETQRYLPARHPSSRPAEFGAARRRAGYAAASPQRLPQPFQTRCQLLPAQHDASSAAPGQQRDWQGHCSLKMPAIALQNLGRRVQCGCWQTMSVKRREQREKEAPVQIRGRTRGLSAPQRPQSATKGGEQECMRENDASRVGFRQWRKRRRKQLVARMRLLTRKRANEQTPRATLLRSPQPHISHIRSVSVHKVN